MARTLSFVGANGANYYFKPDPFVTPWGNDVIAADPGLANVYSATVGDGAYFVFRRAGAQPAATDQIIAQFGRAINLSPQVNLTVTPGVALQTLQQDGSPLVAYRGSLSILSLTVLDTALQPIDLEGKTLQLQIGQPGRPALQTVSDLEATGANNNVVSFRPNASLVQMPRSTCWSLFDVTDSEHPEHIVSGVFEVRDAISPQ